MLSFGLFSFYFIIICLIAYYLRYPTNRKWWVKIVTKEPVCTYYFGPFNSAEEAQGNQVGYIKDLREEGAKNILVTIEYCQPRKLTICEEDSEMKHLIGSRAS